MSRCTEPIVNEHVAVFKKKSNELNADALPTRRERCPQTRHEINGRDLKSENLDAALATVEGRPRPMACKRAQTVTRWGTPPRTDIIFSTKNKERYFLSFLLAHSPVQPTAEVK